MPKYPGQIDDSQSLPPAINGFTPVEGKVFNRLRDAVIAIENELGTKPSASYGTVKNRLSTLETTISNFTSIDLDGDLGGTEGSPKVIGLQGNPVANDTPTLNDLLTWNGIAWEPSPLNHTYVDGYFAVETLAKVLARGNSANNLKITNLATPTASTDAATKAYVDSQATVNTLTKVLSNANTTDGYNIVFSNDGNLRIDNSNSTFSIGWSAGNSGNGKHISITGQNALSGNGNGGNLLFTSGTKNGAGTDGYIVASGIVYIKDLNSTQYLSLKANTTELKISSLDSTSTCINTTLVGQNTSSASSTTAGKLFLKGGDMTGANGGFGGGVYIGGGSATGVAGSRTGADVFIYAGTGASNNGVIRFNAPGNTATTGSRMLISDTDIKLFGTNVFAGDCKLFVDANGLRFFDGNSPVGRATITGSRGGNAALENLLIALENYGLIVDSTTS